MDVPGKNLFEENVAWQKWSGGAKGDNPEESLPSLCETCYTQLVKTITIRDLRQRWPQTEKALEVENEIIVTRDGRPVAKLIRIIAETTKRKRWNAQAHLRWMKKLWGERVFESSDAALSKARADRWESGHQ
jgi:antitoxin (DNA-binding transcriptional repressor) of toxin-antitoxin stability system